jgi:uncharacterized membrane protein (Fun14 family)
MLPRTRLLNFSRLFSRQARSVASSSVAGGQPNRLLKPRLTLVGCSTIAVLIWAVPSAECASANDDKVPEKQDNSGDAMEIFLKRTVYPACNKLGFGGIMGFCTGIAVKKVGEAVAILVGVSFIGLQYAQYKGLIDIDWLKVKEMCKFIPRRSNFVSVCLSFLMN